MSPFDERSAWKCGGQTGTSRNFTAELIASMSLCTTEIPTQCALVPPKKKKTALHSLRTTSVRV